MDGVIRDRAEATGVTVDAMRADYLKNISLRRMVTAQDVAATAAFLISDAGANLSGQSLAVDGKYRSLIAKLRHWSKKPTHRQGYHHLCRNRCHSYAVHVATSAGNAERDH